MAAREHQVEIDKIDITLKSIEQVLNLPKLIENAALLEEQASAPNLWDDPQAAQVVTSKLSRAQSTINKINGIRSRLNDLPIMIEIANGETDKTSAFKDIDKELDDLTQVIKDLEVQTLLSGEYDERDALITIRSEAGGVEAADWAQMLMRMYVRFCERHNYKVEVLETSYAEEAGIKSTTFRVNAPYAYGRLSVEQGTHRLVRISPFDSQSRRHTSFAGVEVVPVVEQSDHIEIEEKVLEFEKEKRKMKMLLKRPKKEGGEAFHEKKDKNKKVNLGGPGKRTPRKTESRNRGVERKRDEKRKKK